MNARLDVHQATPGMARSASTGMPWPLQMLIAIGAWLAAIPLTFAFALYAQDRLIEGQAGYIAGTLLLACTVLGVRSLKRYFFIQQFAAPAIIAGLLLLGFSLFRDLNTNVAAALLALFVLAMAILLPIAWLRTLLAAPTCALLVLAQLPHGVDWLHEHSLTSDMLFEAGLTVLAIWLFLTYVQYAVFNKPDDQGSADALAAISSGWALCMLAGFCLWSGMAFLISAIMDNTGWIGVLAQDLFKARDNGLPGNYWGRESSLLALVAAALLLCAWPGLRRTLSAILALVLAILAWYLPALGPVLLILAVSLATGRRSLSMVAGLAAAWILGSVYYNPNWLLMEKAAMLAAIGVLLGACALLAARSMAKTVIGSQTLATHPARSGMAVAATLLSVLIIGNAAIWNREQLIKNGQPVFFELRILDPRSLMQGDYMSLNFFNDTSSDINYAYQTPLRIVATRDARNIGTMLRLHQDETLASNEFLIEIHRKNSRLVMASNAWFFKEGNGERWWQARYGEFRVMPNGKIILVNLRGKDLQAL
ncbi:GDYXXLXY domain-containing protein [Janthinobacterium lividum]|uniref:GDYXXLXY domain-containing protein n=1 Tax=Janthinobacterium lividum TaxID=29581 RepID=UPI0008933066|nr:GDYXXLXY domain-containing protein [Janthinobacterium lividum]MCC7712089.1 GDYXXLXY domain-containing protein [Janthinobacterium lividum]OEZ53833.1 hypothetical protein JANLI_40270 [Janthinobacterium lividum]WQE27227.1 GDYXXLXY domain-containing protein [Janthinobacterium lividum]STQ98120.1 Uncharacterized membrane-anchored protein [Janthinobacterium lividum]